eukprot:scaffold183657_cov31-Tisochrysis_lutea.AAC.1
MQTIDASAIALRESSQAPSDFPVFRWPDETIAKMLSSASRVSPCGTSGFRAPRARAPKKGPRSGRSSDGERRTLTAVSSSSSSHRLTSVCSEATSAGERESLLRIERQHAMNGECAGTPLASSSHRCTSSPRAVAAAASSARACCSIARSSGLTAGSPSERNAAETSPPSTTAACAALASSAVPSASNLSPAPLPPASRSATASPTTLSTSADAPSPSAAAAAASPAEARLLRPSRTSLECG